MSATVASHAAAVFAYLVLTLLLLLSRSSTLLGRLLLVTCGVTTLWAALVVYHDLLPYRFPLAVELAEIARTACWLLFLGGLIVPTATWLAPSWRRQLVAGLLAASAVSAQELTPDSPKLAVETPAVDIGLDFEAVGD